MTKATVQLNDKQRKLVEDNHNLIYSFLNKHELHSREWYDVCAIGLCRAALHYNGSSQFSTFAYKCMLNEVRKVMRISRTQKSVPDSETISLSTEVRIVCDKTTYTLDEFIPSKSNTEDEALGKIWVEWFIEKVPLTTLKVLYGKLNEKTCRELAEDLGVSFSRISAVTRKLQEYCKRNSRYVPRSTNDEDERQKYIEQIKILLDKLS
ncbi:MAG TPA: hypothetical protein DCW90_15890 [Lachnospiraceae bacterium]|nr:hypothetical protein [Lachnospiraceae bacterium]